VVERSRRILDQLEGADDRRARASRRTQSAAHDPQLPLFGG